MNVRPADIRRLLVIYADTLTWAECAGLRADFWKLWRKHDSLLARLESRRRGTGNVVDQLRQLEIAVWSEVALASLERKTLNRLAASLAPDAGGLWGSIARQTEQDRIDPTMLRATSALEAFDDALLGFRRWPSEICVREALESLEALVDIAAPRWPVYSTTELKAGVDDLVQTLPSVLAPDAAAFLASIMAERFRAQVDEAWLAHVPTIPRKRWERTWTPSWEQLEQVTLPVEPSAEWFRPNVQRRYEEMLLARELERSHTEALAEDARRSEEIAGRERRRMEAAKLERDLALARRRIEHRETIVMPRRRAEFLAGGQQRR